MAGLKDLSLDKKVSLAVAVLFCVVSGCWIATFTTRNFLSPDAYDYAQMGREIKRGHGLATLDLFPRHIAYLKEHNLLNLSWLPNLNRYPLPTFCNALAQVFVADPVRASVIQSGIWFLLSIPIFYLLARGLMEPFRAFICTVLFVSRTGIWAASNNGLAESLTILLLLSLLYLLTKRSASIWKYAAVGLLGALLCLARTQFAYAFVIAVGYMAATSPKPERWRAALISGVVFTLAFSPWMIRNYQLTGNPLFSFHNSRVLAVETTPSHSDLDMQLHAPVDMGTILRAYGAGIAMKFFNNLVMGTLKFSRSVGFYVYEMAAIVVVSRLFKQRNTSAQYEHFKWFTVAMFCANILIISVVFADERYSYPLQPLLIIVLVQELFVILENKAGERARKIAVYALLVFGCAFFIKNVTQKYDKRNDGAYERLAHILKPTSIVATDPAYATALFNDVLSIRLPHYPADLLEISEKYIPIDYVMISAMVLRSKPTDHSSWYKSYAAYPEFIKTETFLSRFEFVENLPAGAVLYKRRELKTQSQ